MSRACSSGPAVPAWPIDGAWPGGSVTAMMGASRRSSRAPRPPSMPWWHGVGPAHVAPSSRSSSHPTKRRPASAASASRGDRGVRAASHAMNHTPVSIRAMFLRQIQIRGFKSFADKTVLEFVPGVSVIVGPNGSGKSNLVDAISWALGEQGPRALRGGQMADVIFAGTPSRPALGMAEVKLVIDNSAGKIPVPMSEIEIARTIFRSGDSEYRIGGQVVRLMDVQELLSESGIGRALHTVVGQGQLEDVLLSRPEDRRKYIEEAAGIAKHRRRKERAERKLGGLDQDLLRLSDVLVELRRQLKPLQQQAEMAKRHETLTAEADRLSRTLAAARLRALVREQERRRDGWDQGLVERSQARQRLDALDERVLGAADARAAATRALTDAEQGVRATTFDRDRAEQRYREAVHREATARTELASEATRAARLDTITQEITRIEALLAETVTELEAQEAARSEEHTSELQSHVNL